MRPSVRAAKGESSEAEPRGAIPGRLTRYLTDPVAFIDDCLPLIYSVSDFDAALPVLPADDGHPLHSPEVIPAGKRNDTLYTLGRSLHAKGVAPSTITKTLLEENRVRCSPPLDESEVRTIATHAAQQPDRPDFKKNRRHLTDLGNARFLVEQHGIDLHYVPAWRSWLVWMGTHWDRSERGQAEQRAKLAVSALYAEAKHQPDEEQRPRQMQHALRSESARGIRAMLELGQTEPGIAVTPSDLDRDPWLLNVANGTLDLRTGTLRTPCRADLITTLIATPYDPGAHAPRWDAFLNQIFAANQELIAFMQRAVGSALTGAMRDQVFFILWGQGANGKSTLVKTLMRLLGSYAGQMATDTLLRAKGGDGTLALNDLATLHGVRFVAATEADRGRPLAEALVKQLTGGDAIKVKRLYQDVFAIEPTFKVFLSTNFRPEIRGTDHAIWRRIRLIPFTVTIPEQEQDRRLIERLATEAPGILAWAVRGCLAWQREGLGEPEAVSQATAAYRLEQDGVGRFLAERCIGERDRRVGAAELANAYNAWAAETSEEPMSAKTLKGRLLERGLTQKIFSAGAFWMGLGLRAAQERATHGGMVDAGGSPRKLSQQRSALERVSGNPTLTHHSTMLARRGVVSPAEPRKAGPARQRDVRASDFLPESDSEGARCSSHAFPEKP